MFGFLVPYFYTHYKFNKKLIINIARNKMWNVCLSGEIHSDWREQIIKGCQLNDLPISFTSPVTDHQSIDPSIKRSGCVCYGMGTNPRASGITAQIYCAE